MREPLTANHPGRAVACLWQGLCWLRKKELRAFLWVPLLINALLFGSALFFAAQSFGQWIDWLIPAGWQWLEWLLWPVFWIGLLLVTFFSFGLVANLLAAPFYGFLAQRTLQLIGATPAASDTPWQRVLRDELQRWGQSLKWLLPLLVVSLLPVVNFAAPFAWATFGAWNLAGEYMAYALELADLPLAEQRALLRRTPLATLSFGALVAFGLTLPLLNILIPPAAVIGATLYWHGGKAPSR